MYKIIFIDIDGTLTDNRKKISKRTIEAIKNITEKNLLVILVSGRPREYVESISSQCHASNYIIASNGGIIYDYIDNKIIYKNNMDKQSIIELYKIAEMNNAMFIMDIDGKQIANKLDKSSGLAILDTNIETFVNKNDVLLCTIFDEDYEKMKNLRKKIEKIKKIEIKQEIKSFGDNDNSDKEKTYYFIANTELSKGHAIKKICQNLNIDLKDTIAIGDDINDISMFKVVGHSVAMENANNIVKKYANEVISSNENNGVAIFLEKLINNCIF